MSEDLTQELMDTLGEDGFFRLVEAHAGLRLYIPAHIDRSELSDTIGIEATARLCNLYRGGYIKVPLAREFRALRYREAGLSNKDIARRLGLTETGVELLFQRARRTKPERGSKPQDPRQLRLF